MPKHPDEVTYLHSDKATAVQALRLLEAMAVCAAKNETQLHPCEVQSICNRALAQIEEEPF